MFCHPVIGPYTFCEPGECHGSLSNSLIEFAVNGQVVCDGRPQVHKFMNDLWFVVVNEERWYLLDVIERPW